MNFIPYGDPEPSEDTLSPTGFFDFEHSLVQEFIQRVVGDVTDPVQAAVRLYYAVRDDIRYDMYGVTLEPQRFKASDVLERGAAFCIPKASLLVAALRGAGVPAVVGTSDVVNHFTTPKMEASMGGKTIFLHHGYAVMLLEGKWVKAVPAFNKELCAKMGVAPTEFDGRSDAILQEFDAEKNVRMTYLKDHGYWTDLPFERISCDFKAYYPKSFF